MDDRELAARLTTIEQMLKEIHEAVLEEYEQEEETKKPEMRKKKDDAED